MLQLAHPNYPTHNFHPVSPSMVCLFRVGCHFETSGPTDPKMTLNTKRSKAPYIHVTTTPQRLSNFSPFRSTASHFPVTSHFESAPTDYKITVNTKRSKVPHLHITTTLESQFSVAFALRLANSKILPIYHSSIGHNDKF